MDPLHSTLFLPLAILISSVLLLVGCMKKKKATAPPLATKEAATMTAAAATKPIPDAKKPGSTKKAEPTEKEPPKVAAPAVKKEEPKKEEPTKQGEQKKDGEVKIRSKLDEPKPKVDEIDLKIERPESDGKVSLGGAKNERLPEDFTCVSYQEAKAQDEVGKSPEKNAAAGKVPQKSPADEGGQKLPALSVDPIELRFSIKEAQTQTVTIINNTDKRMALKVKCSDSLLFRASTVYAIVEAKSKIPMTVLRSVGGVAGKLDQVVVVYAEAGADDKDAKEVISRAGTNVAHIQIACSTK